MAIHPTADIAADASISESAAIWNLAQVREGAAIGALTIVGRGAYIGTGVFVGSRCKIQNFAQIFEPATIEDGVFIGPGVTLTNDQYPRAVTPAGELKAASDWEPVGVEVRHGASIGARAVCVAPLVVGRWSMVAAGSVVIRDVKDFALVAGTPAKQIGWVGRDGRQLEWNQSEERWVCPVSGAQFIEFEGQLREDEVE